MKSEQTTRRLVTSAMLIAVASVLALVSEFIPFLQLRFGGTLTLASMLPIILISYMYGLKWGLGSAAVYAVIQIFMGFKTVAALFTPDSDSYMALWMAICVVLLDYFLAYTSLGLGGIFARKKGGCLRLVLGGVVAQVICYAFHVLSGFLFYGAWADWFFTESAAKDLAISGWIMEHLSGRGLALLYSLIYNALYMLPEIVLTAAVAALIYRIPAVSKNFERR
ncbi:MAG: ECF transporter S component [Candidatus Faecousia sp.]|uniref:energy-coupled thiamine transporter ThiT n=1 Tax=Faecousia sp. TaxID=2952921 RepID=UPI002A883EBE|nr:ECF transporter S component [Candidatus Faecousia sp.]